MRTKENDASFLSPDECVMAEPSCRLDHLRRHSFPGSIELPARAIQPLRLRPTVMRRTELRPIEKILQDVARRDGLAAPLQEQGVAQACFGPGKARCGRLVGTLRFVEGVQSLERSRKQQLRVGRLEVR